MTFMSSVRAALLCRPVALLVGLFSASAAYSQTVAAVDRLGVFDDTGMRIGGMVSDRNHIKYEMEGVIVRVFLGLSSIFVDEENSLYFSGTSCSGQLLFRVDGDYTAYNQSNQIGNVVCVENRDAPPVGSAASEYDAGSETCFPS
jgi:hypothetical protein